MISVGIWHRPGAKFALSCHFWCTPDGRLPSLPKLFNDSTVQLYDKAQRITSGFGAGWWALGFLNWA